MTNNKLNDWNTVAVVVFFCFILSWTEYFCFVVINYILLLLLMCYYYIVVPFIEIHPNYFGLIVNKINQK